jgi:ABC-type bacteriocin/lantibiotic exporter with double-glycine peptidase domain
VRRTPILLSTGFVKEPQKKFILFELNNKTTKLNSKTIVSKNRTLNKLKNMNNLTALQRFFALLSIDKKEISNIYIFAIFSGLINLSLPLGIQAIINLINIGEVSTSWIILVALVIGGMVMVGILQIMQLTITENLQQKIFTRAAFEFAYRLPRMQMSAVRKYYGPELVNRFFDTLNIQKGIPKILIDLSQASLQVFFGLILLSFYHPFFIFFSLFILLMLFLIIRLTGPTGLKTSLMESKYKYAVAHWLEEVARTLETFKLAGKTNLPLEKTDALVTGYLKSRNNHFRTLLRQYISMVTLRAIIAAGLLILGGMLVIQQQMNIGQFVAAEIVIILVLAAIEKIILSMETIYDVLTAIEKIGTVTDLPLEDTATDRITDITKEEGLSVRLRDFSYRFEDAHDDIIKDFNLHISPGEKVCIAGFSGSGKSLLLQIIAGLYESYRGTIAYNNIPLGNVDLTELRYIMGDSLAREDIFSGTIAENISMGRPGINFDDIKKSAEIVGLTEYVEGIREGYNKVLDPEGRKLPKTIAQKIMLARSIIGKPKMILLEDTFNKLETLDRERLMDYLLNENNGCTVIAVSNDPKVASHFNRIVALKDGEMIDCGTFEEAMKKDWYAEVFNV